MFTFRAIESENKRTKMKSNSGLFLWAIVCLCSVSAEALSTHLPTYATKRNLIQNLTSSYSAFLDDVYYYLGSIRNVSEACRNDIQEIRSLASAGNADALKIFDSTGKIESGILEGGVYFIGFYSECVNTVVKAEQNTLSSQYCLLNLNFSGAAHQDVLPAVSWEVFTKAGKPPTIGICIPSSCSNEDVQYATDASLNDNFADVVGNVAVCHADTKGFSQDIPAIIFFCFQSVVVLIMIVATSLDYYLQWRTKQEGRSDSTELLCDQPVYEESSRAKFMKYLLAFSVFTNAPKILSVKGKDNISCLHGLRFLTMALIIFGHTFTFASSTLFFRNPGFATKAPKDFLSQLFANGTFAVDTFFFMSGLLVCYVSMKSLESVTKKWSWLLIFYVHRYVRLTPLMMAVIFNCALFLRYISSGPNWMASILMFDDWCRKQWWTNALYIHNFYNTNSMCLSHSWYLATDFQMFLVAPLILLPLYWNCKAGFGSMGIFLLITTVVTGVITAQNHYPAIPYINEVVPLDVVNAYYKDVYIKPYCRMGPFIVGIALGYFLYQKKQYHMNKSLVAFCWILSMASGLAVIYLMWPANQGILPTNAEAATYSALARTVWGICLAWLVFACQYGYAGFINSILSWSFWIPLSRLTYPAYLVHPVVMSVYYGSTEGVREFSASFMLYTFIGNICITYLIALLFSLMYESPFVVMEKIILRPQKKPATEEASPKL